MTREGCHIPPESQRLLASPTHAYPLGVSSGLGETTLSTYRPPGQLYTPNLDSMRHGTPPRFLPFSGPTCIV